MGPPGRAEGGHHRYTETGPEESRSDARHTRAPVVRKGPEYTRPLKSAPLAVRIPFGQTQTLVLAVDETVHGWTP